MGGKRPGAGPKVNISEKLVAIDVALQMDVGLSHARVLIREWGSAERIIGSERVHNLRKWGFSKRGPNTWSITGKPTLTGGRRRG